MFCKNCGEQLTDNATFCGKGGAPVTNESTQNNTQKNDKKLKGIIIAISVAIVALIIVGVALIASGNTKETPEEAEKNNNVTTIEAVKDTEKASDINVNKDAIIPADTSAPYGQNYNSQTPYATTPHATPPSAQRPNVTAPKETKPSPQAPTPQKPAPQTPATTAPRVTTPPATQAVPTPTQPPATQATTRAPQHTTQMYGDVVIEGAGM